MAITFFFLSIHAHFFNTGGVSVCDIYGESGVMGIHYIEEVFGGGGGELDVLCAVQLFAVFMSCLFSASIFRVQSNTMVVVVT